MLPVGPPRAGDPGLDSETVGQQALTKSQARQSRQLLEGYYINLSVEFIAPRAPSRSVDAGTDSLINGQGGRREGCLQTLPYSLASAFTAPRIAFWTTGRPSHRAAEYNGGLKGPLFLNT